MEGIYLDNACTSYPKPEAVPKAMYEYMTQNGSNINRGCYGRAYETEALVFDTRTLLKELFHAEDEKYVIFTANITESMNALLKGLLHSGDHVLVSSMEHNAIMRPLNQLAEEGVTYDRIPCDDEGRLILAELPQLLKPETRAVVMAHASNVSGTILPIREVGAFCHERGILFLVDTAQTAGSIPIDMRENHIDGLGFTGHKGLMGPQGIGGFVLSARLAGELKPFITGGTGSRSHLEVQPELLPDKFEAGTQNLPGIVGLHEALLWLRETGIESIHRAEMILTKQFTDGLRSLCDRGKLRIVGPALTEESKTSVVSVACLQKDAATVAAELEEKYGIQTRVGLHCAPAAHRTLGTYPQGTVRFSFGYFNTKEDVERALTALYEVMDDGSETP